MLLDFFKLNRQQRETLTDVVMELSGDSGTFLLLRFNQPAVHVGEGLLRKFAVGDIDTRPYVTSKRIINEPRHANVDNPSIYSVVAAETILHPEFFPAFEGSRISIETAGQVLRVDAVRPAVPKLRL